ncbi:MAG: exopolyphosphatase, partial [Candidatus Rokubacteria bacterium]|nr:exopolyphosphatase [Candidatus Rokubacteria bacterium]
PCLEPGRADLIIPGIAIVLGALDVTGAGGVLASDWGLREGLLVEALGGLP